MLAILFQSAEIVEFSNHFADGEYPPPMPMQYRCPSFSIFPVFGEMATIPSNRATGLR